MSKKVFTFLIVLMENPLCELGHILLPARPCVKARGKGRLVFEHGASQLQGEETSGLWRVRAGQKRSSSCGDHICFIVPPPIRVDVRRKLPNVPLEWPRMTASLSPGLIVNT